MKKRLLLFTFLISGVLMFAMPAQVSALWYSGTHLDTAATTTFQVNMHIKMLEGTFLPASNDSVWARGNFNNWGTTLLTDPDGDSIYTGTVLVESLYYSPTTHAPNIGDTILYKYFKTSRGGLSWESDPNRELIISSDPVSTPVDVFDRDTVYNPPVSNVNVTFQVNMRIKMEETSFQPGSGDIVTVRGSFNNWGNNPPGNIDTLTDPNNDSIYTKTLSIPGNSTIAYKFWKTLRGGVEWESVPNRSFDVGATNVTIPSVYFDGDSVYTPPVSVNITFQVNMKVKMLEQTFQPQNGDIVRIAGSFDSWGGSTDTLTDPDVDSIYTKTVSLLEGQAIQYKFLKTPRGGSDWENNQPTSSGNREYTVPSTSASLPVVYFNDDSIINTPINANIIWRVDMSVYRQLGWFDPSGGDTIQVRGPFNGWAGTVLAQNPFIPSQYRVLIPYSGTAYDNLPYKFFLQLASATAESRFPGWAANNDGVQYDHPAERGDGNRLFDVGTGGNISTPSFYFSSINPGGIIPAGDTVSVTLSVNMGPATRYTVPFDPNTDTVRIVWQDALWRATQTKSHGTPFNNIDMAPVSAGDSIYQATFDVIGPTHYNMQYTYRYLAPGGGSTDQGGGLGGQNPFQTRFITPTSPGVFPRNYSAATDVWQKNAPLAAETPPLNTVTGVLEGKNPGVPLVYKLEQNYPNPFNPSTKISYSIPERSNVTLKVFNLIGQEVATLVNEQKDPGNYFAHFDASKMASGVYFYQIEAGKFTSVKKMLLMK